MSLQQEYDKNIEELKKSTENIELIRNDIRMLDEYYAEKLGSSLFTCTDAAPR